MDVGLVGFVIESDVFDPPDDDPGAFDRGARLQAADIVELRSDFVRRVEVQGEQIGRFKGEKQHRHDSDQHEQADP